MLEATVKCLYVHVLFAHWLFIGGRSRDEFQCTTNFIFDLGAFLILTDIHRCGGSQQPSYVIVAEIQTNQ